MGVLRNQRNEVFTAKQKWDYIDLDTFKTRSCWAPVGYFFFFVNMFFGVAVVAADCYTAVNLLIFNRWSSKIQPWVPFNISKWIFAGCILFSFVLIGLELLWCIRAVRGGSVSRGYLNVYAARWYCIGNKGYKRFLVFVSLTKSKKGSDYVMFFSYFSFKGWAQILLADGPRQVLNGITLYAVMQAKIVPGTAKDGLPGLLASIKQLEQESLTQAILLSVMLFTCVWWIFSFLQLASAAFLWIMFIWHHVPSGHTLGSYCREKIDKRLVGIIDKNHKRTLQEEQEERMKADKAGNVARKPTIPILGVDGSALGPGKAPMGNPSLPSINEKPPGFGMKRTNTMDTFTTTVSSRPDTNMPSRPPFAARPAFPSRSETMGTDASSMYDDSASLLGTGRKDPFSRTGTPLNRPQPPIGPYSRHGQNSSQASLSDPYNSAPLQPHDFLGSSQGLPPINRNDTVSPFFPGQMPPPVNRMDTVSPMHMAPTLPNLNFDSMRTGTPQPFPAAAGIQRFPPRSQEQNFAPQLAQPTNYASPPGSDFSAYTEHRHSPPIHHKPQSEVFEMDSGIVGPAPPPKAGTVEMDASLPSGAFEMSSSPPKAIAKDGPTGNFSSHPMAFELDTGVPTSSTPQPQPLTRRLTPPTLSSTPRPQNQSPPRTVANPYMKPAYQPATYQSTAPSAPIPSSTPAPQLPQIPHNDYNFGQEKRGADHDNYNYDIEADVLDSYATSDYQQPPQRPYANQHSQGQQGSRPSTPTRGLPVRRDEEPGYGNGFAPPQRSMTSTPGSHGGFGAPQDFTPPNRSMSANPYHQDVRMSPPRGSNGMNRPPPRGPPPPQMGGGYGRNDGYRGNNHGGYGGNGGW